jgi:hypothetical protein
MGVRIVVTVSEVLFASTFRVDKSRLSECSCYIGLRSTARCEVEFGELQGPTWMVERELGSKLWLISRKNAVKV